ncbi:MAG: MobA/MobL family protein [Janthinobacterium lividum]
MMLAPITSPADLAAIRALSSTLPPNPFDITPVIHLQQGQPSDRSRTFWSAVANALYIVRQDGEDVYGPTPRFSEKLASCPDLIDSGRRGPIGCDADNLAGLQLWRAADQAALTDRPSAPVAFHAVGWLPTNMTQHGWRELILQYLDEQIVSAGMVADWALHALAAESGGWIKKPHFHAVITSRFWKGPRMGQPQPAWFQTAKHRAATGDAWAHLCE